MAIGYAAIGATFVLLILKACGVVSWWIVSLPLLTRLLISVSVWVFARLSLWLAE